MLDRFGLPVWANETIISVAIVLGAIVAAFIVIAILGIVRRHIAKRTATDLDDKIIDALKKPLHLVMILAGITVAMQRLQGRFPETNEWIFKTTDQTVIAIIILVVAFFAIKMIRILTEWYAQKAEQAEVPLSAEFTPLLNRIAKILVLAFAVLMVLDHFSVDIKGLVAVLGVGSLAIALAAQDTVANTIGGFIIMMDRPFRKGDRVVLPNGEMGDVYQIGLRSSKFLTFEHTLIVVPNSELVKSTITNLSYPYEEIRVKIDVGVAYGSDIEQVKTLLVQAAKDHHDILESFEPVAYFVGFGDSSLDFTLICRVEKVGQQWQVGEQIRCAIYNRFNEAGIEIPFPQRVVYLHQEKSD
ncbi:MAG: mechanosensitive ion channel family protein [bacterium]